ncbi:hypothetical protein COCSUDRAFT_58082 [Coccomyxa subellipsoidea C-169]|uniref:Uncharacterized protein n=1 Tax=Coccomyxa subellipsoidea (strain C-169) TaxID=574566 RepID=I0YN76_COCSC|nr:hypothetical protein COCSUDRAFT_58082 [Coccomyxa subellipsoidea C-169]EIE19845.1 hypothetical protein COCSUDRAFT_58082 [Coccomyxa subellipsoidea C-169]|eukprot:XP_005644389.1 hypothetical protein COCSUDRAFT_58082 [Coccomyxa subellipsoidea C-169]
MPHGVGVLTGVFLGIMAACCFLMSFTDSITDAGGRICYGVVTRKGLWWAGVRQEYGYPPGEQPVTDEEQAPNRNGQPHDALLDAHPVAAASDNNIQQPPSPWDSKYKRTGVDWAHASISVLTFLTLSMLTPPVSTCFFGACLPPNIALAVPILVGILASVMFTLIGAPRKGIGFPGQDLAK